ncbi:uncharacterized protein LOC117285845 [Fukomys damarensis]|uniref:uncharacterized protein LOC117285845 n=1 Tax=Fukomys damarensis TaxID=885580 RepID=UPI00145513FA|nr:uncharacterized protein LOC117285845 [Fukomys damarensis]
MVIFTCLEGRGRLRRETELAPLQATGPPTPCSCLPARGFVQGAGRDSVCPTVSSDNTFFACITTRFAGDSHLVDSTLPVSSKSQKARRRQPGPGTSGSPRKEAVVPTRGSAAEATVGAGGPGLWALGNPGAGGLSWGRGGRADWLRSGEGGSSDERADSETTADSLLCALDDPARFLRFAVDKYYSFSVVFIIESLPQSSGDQTQDLALARQEQSH